MTTTRSSTTRSHRRARWVAAAVAAALTLVVVTWAVASSFQSPAQREAAAVPPTAQPVLVDVTRTDLVERTTTMASATRDQARTLAIPRPAGTAVVTADGVTAGTSLSSGQVVTWVNDRPVIALRGPFPLFRDIGEGDSGEDVRMVQQALADLGYGINPDGSFGSYTASCLKDLYRANGSTVPTRAAEEASAAAGSATPSTQTPATAAGDTQASAPSSAGGTSASKKEVYLPVSEVLVVTHLPGQVGSVPGVGTTLTDANASLVLTGDTLTLGAQVPGPVAVRLSQEVTGTAELDGQSVPVQVSAVTATPVGATGTGSDGGQAGSQEQSGTSTVTFTATQRAFPAEWADHQDVLVTLDLTKPLTDVLTVPQRAVSTDSTGASSVLLLTEDSSFHQVSVTVQACVGGVCAIAEPDPSTGLVEGSHVRVDR